VRNRVVWIDDECEFVDVWIDDECEFVDVWMWHHNTVRCIDAFLNSCLRPR